MERRTKIVELDPAEVAGLVARLLPEAELRDQRLITSGRANTNYLLELAGPKRRVVLRLYVRSAACCGKEVALCRSAPVGVPVPEVLAWSQESKPHPCALFSFLPGRTLEEWIQAGEAAAGMGRALGRVLAALGQPEFEAQGDLLAPDGETLVVKSWGLGDDPAQEFVRQCLFEGPAGERLGDELRDALWDHVQAQSQRWPAQGQPARLVHGDFNPSNLLLERADQEWVVTGVLDWEFAHAGSPLADVGNLLRARPDQPLPAGFAAQLRQGLEEGGASLPDDWEERAAFMDLTSALEFLSSREDRPQVHQRARAQVAAALGRSPADPGSK